ncbi:hypothetical protein A2397_00095 [Candidatus Amesbacteria bacterium RIFOXYB1_FULL_44_23]|uniref:DNA-directed DNA polymerase n=1 Tax=Candidatus Amesbacteria bacterium RIFOXYB1_FULL_44_23 TaxID=1797263 RepID=A0A1F4ZXU3_9BACT|nr:MAG: hypothetical protein A2397_00095 [Candidatus Amesbacteria bacterium RIFOXYB1_FULL_44_23]
MITKQLSIIYIHSKMKTNRQMTNLQISKLLKAVAAALELSSQDYNRFRVIAYDRAADAIEHSSSEIKDLWDDGQLKTVPGIGDQIASHLDELFKTGKVDHFNQILKPFPPAMFELLDIPGLGPKTAFKLCKALGISKAHTAIASLQKAAKKGHIAQIEGFGDDSQAAILKGIEDFNNRGSRLLLPQAEKISTDLIAWLEKSPHTQKADPLGSLRRKVATVGDVDISVSSSDPKQVIEHFTNYPKKLRILEAGDKTASIILPNDYQVDLMVQDPKSYGSLLQHFTGSKHHNIALRELALKKGLSLSEYGIKTKLGLKTFATEEDFYKYLGLDWIPPELREDAGEIAAAQNHSLPTLIELDEIRGDLQVHSDINLEPSHDLGQSSLDELAQTAKSLKYEYLGLTEHNPSVSEHTDKQVTDLIKRKTDLITQFNHTHENNSEKIPYLFNGLEIDIQANGKRALSDANLDLLDYACVSIHSSFDQTRKEMTDRVLSGLNHPKVKFFAHPTGRLLGQREGIELDWDQIFDFCLKNDKWLEIDAWPNRLDLPDVQVREAVKRGVKLTVDTDSHNHTHLHYMKYGVWVAKRGWAKKSDIINTLPFDQLIKIIK